MDIMEIKPWQLSVLRFNPESVYNRIEVNRFKRWQSISMEQAFPTIVNGICACGCGTELTGRQRRWASEDCQYFALGVIQIIKGDPVFIERYLELHNGNKNCALCGKSEMDCPKELWRDNYRFIQKDHIIPVHKGGGACWLDNYQFLCDICHKAKTKKDVRP